MKDNCIHVRCPSCEALFEATDPELIGQIVACPKCGGMMMVEPAPEGESQEEAAAAPEQETAQESDASTTASDANDELAETPEQTLPTQESPESQNEEPRESDEEDAPGKKSRASLPLVASGVICALIAALVFGFVRAYRATPDVPPIAAAPKTETGDENATAADEAPSEPDASADQNDVAADETTEEGSEDDSFGDESELALDAHVDGIDEFGAGDVIAPADPDVAGGEETAPDDVEVADESNDAPLDEDAADPVEDDDVEEAVEPDAPEESETALPEESESEDEDEEPEDDALPTEFDEAEFEKENQAEAESDEEEEEDLGAVASTTDVTLQNSLPVLKGEPKAIDVDARMALRIRSIVFPESPAAATRLLSEFSGVPIVLDLERFPLLRPSLNMRLDLKLDDVSVDEALAKEAEMLKWNVRKESDCVTIEPQTDDLSALVEQRFNVEDLLADDAPFLVKVGDDATDAPSKISGDALVDFVRSLATPDRWGDGEGQGTIRVEGTELVVTNDALSRKSVEILLEQLRVLRRLDSANSIATENLIPESRGWETLAKKTSFNLLKPISLQQALDTLENKYDFLTLWDDATLNAAGVGRESTTGARFDSAPIEKVLTELLDPFALTFVILDEKLILVTTKEKANQYRTVEIHGFSTLESTKTFEESLKIANEMKSAVAPESWGEGDAAIWLDAENGCLIVRQSQPVQRAIRRWTDALVEKEKEKEKKKAGRTSSPIRGGAAPEIASRPEE